MCSTRHNALSLWSLIVTKWVLLTVTEPTTLGDASDQVPGGGWPWGHSSDISAGDMVTADQSWHWHWSPTDESFQSVQRQLRPERGCWSLQRLTAAAEVESSDQPTSESTAVTITTTKKCSQHRYYAEDGDMRPWRRSSQFVPPCLRQIFRSSRVSKCLYLFNFWFYWFLVSGNLGGLTILSIDVHTSSIFIIFMVLSMVFIFITRRSYYYYYDKYYGVILLLSLFYFHLSFDVSSVIVHHVRRVVAVDLIRQTSLRRELTLTVRHGRWH